MVFARYEVSTAAYLRYWVFWDVTDPGIQHHIPEDLNSQQGS